ncbi:hypothetical protein CEXT_74021 [Caerostris extrusa]|uniref:Uncharacterized protein n=1 Tax=Caerostris extrusa TaxID=172846 RepID=A0AAV4VH64_CAEEX|nr:hypothetical protein CEXT_74021 [Caerostris extrusa]
MCLPSSSLSLCLSLFTWCYFKTIVPVYEEFHKVPSPLWGGGYWIISAAGGCSSGVGWGEGQSRLDISGPLPSILCAKSPIKSPLHYGGGGSFGLQVDVQGGWGKDSRDWTFLGIAFNNGCRMCSNVNRVKLEFHKAPIISQSYQNPVQFNTTTHYIQFLREEKFGRNFNIFYHNPCILWRVYEVIFKVTGHRFWGFLEEANVFAVAKDWSVMAWTCEGDGQSPSILFNNPSICIYPSSCLVSLRVCLCSYFKVPEIDPFRDCGEIPENGCGGVWTGEFRGMALGVVKSPGVRAGYGAEDCRFHSFLGVPVGETTGWAFNLSSWSVRGTCCWNYLGRNSL